MVSEALGVEVYEHSLEDYEGSGEKVSDQSVLGCVNDESERESQCEVRVKCVARVRE